MCIRDSVEAEPPAAQADVLLDELAPGQAAHPGFQFCKVEWLGKIIVRPGIPVSYTHLDVYKRQDCLPAQNALFLYIP